MQKNTLSADTIDPEYIYVLHALITQNLARDLIKGLAELDYDAYETLREAVYSIERVKDVAAIFKAH